MTLGLSDIFLFLLIILSSAALGFQLIKLFKLEVEEIIKILFSVVLGFGALGNLILILGSFNLLKSNLLLIIMLIITLLGINEIVHNFRKIVKILRGTYDQLYSMSLFQKFLLIIIFINLILFFVLSLAPTTSADSLYYHFPLAKIYLEKNNTHFVTEVPLSTTPQLIEMLYVLCSITNSYIVPQLLNWVLGLLFFAGAGIFAKKLFNKKTSILSTCLLVSISNMNFLLSSGKTEIGSACFFIFSMMALLFWKKTFCLRYIFLASIYLGFFGSTKLPNILSVLMIGFAMLIFVMKLKHRKKLISHLLVFLMISISINCVWFVRSYLISENPVHPFLSDVFGGKYLFDSKNIAISHENPQTGWGDPLKTPGRFFSDRSLKKLIISPFALTFDIERYRGTPGPIFLILLPVIFLKRNKYNSSQKFILSILAFSYLGWYFSYSMLRTLIPFFALYSPYASTEILNLKKKNWINNIILNFSLFSWFTISLVDTLMDTMKTLPVVVGLENSEDWLSKRFSEKDVKFDHFKACVFINSNLNSESKVLFWGNRGGYINRKYQLLWPFIYGIANWENINDKDTILDELKLWDITHLLVYEDGKRDWFFNLLKKTNKLETIYTDEHSKVIKILYDS